MKFIRPVDDSTPNVTSAFGPNHRGVDYGYPSGTKVYASADGTVVIAKGYETRTWLANTPSDPYPHPRALRTEDYGNFLKIGHAENFSTLYAHLLYDSLYVEHNQAVKKGQLIAEIGSTGNSSGPHLHWETRLNEVVVNPAPYMEEGTYSQTGGVVVDDQVRKDRDRNWNLYTGLLRVVCDNLGIAYPNDPLTFNNQNVVNKINELKNKPGGNPKADALLKAVKEAVR